MIMEKRKITESETVAGIPDDLLSAGIPEAPASVPEKKPFSAINLMMEWEDGTLDKEGTIELFQYLVDSGMAWSLQGMYGRAAVQLIEAGLVTRPE